LVLHYCMANSVSNLLKHNCTLKRSEKTKEIFS
jgi:hypothetical protein